MKFIRLLSICLFSLPRYSQKAVTVSALIGYSASMLLQDSINDSKYLQNDFHIEMQENM
jgi:hypothetical protein